MFKEKLALKKTLQISFCKNLIKHILLFLSVLTLFSCSSKKRYNSNQYYQQRYKEPNSRIYQNPYAVPQYYYPDTDYYYLPPQNQYNVEPVQKFGVDYR